MPHHKHTSDKGTNATELLSLMAHQLRTPLAVLRLNVDLLQNEIGHMLHGENAEVFTEIQQATKRIRKYIEDVLYVGYVEIGDVRREPHDVQIIKCIEQVIAMYEYVAAEKKITIERNVGQKKVELYEDPHLIRIVLDTIFSNAIKYSPKHGVIRISLQEKDHVVTVGIGDQGPGIPTELRQIIFDKYYRGHDAVKRHIKGEGVGLYLAHRVMSDFIGGTIRIRSNPSGKGSTFYCDFPKNL